MYGSTSEVEDTMLRITVFRNVTPCSLAGEYRCFRRIYYFHLQDRWDTFGFSESLVLIYQTVQRHFCGKKHDFDTRHLKGKLCLLFFIVLHYMVLHFFLQFTLLKPQNSKALVFLSSVVHTCLPPKSLLRCFRSPIRYPEFSLLITKIKGKEDGDRVFWRNSNKMEPDWRHSRITKRTVQFLRLSPGTKQIQTFP